MRSALLQPPHCVTASDPFASHLIHSSSSWSWSDMQRLRAASDEINRSSRAVGRLSIPDAFKEAQQLDLGLLFTAPNDKLSTPTGFTETPSNRRNPLPLSSSSTPTYRLGALHSTSRPVAVLDSPPEPLTITGKGATNSYRGDETYTSLSFGASSSSPASPLQQALATHQVAKTLSDNAATCSRPRRLSAKRALHSSSREAMFGQTRLQQRDATMVFRSRPGVFDTSPVGKGPEHRRTTSDYLDAHQARARSPRKPLPKGVGVPELNDEDEDEEAIEAALIRFQWIHESKRGTAAAAQRSGLGSLAIPVSDTVEMLSSPKLERSRKAGHGHGHGHGRTASSSVSRSRRSRSKSSASSLRDVFTDVDSDPFRLPSERLGGSSSRRSSDKDREAEAEVPSLMSVDSLDLGQFNFPPPPKTLRERHSHGCLRVALVHPEEPSPPLRFKPAVPTRSPLRERRAKPPLHLALDSKSDTMKKSGHQAGSHHHPLPSPDFSKSLNSATPFSPPPCPPPATPLPDLPTPSSEDGGGAYRHLVHSRKSSSASTAAAAQSESRRSSSHSSDVHFGAAVLPPGVKGYAQMRKRSFGRAHSASPSIAKPRASSASGGGGVTGAGKPDTPPHSGSSATFSPGLAHSAMSTTTGPNPAASLYAHVSSDEFFKLFDDVVALSRHTDVGGEKPLSPPPSARNSRSSQNGTTTTAVVRSTSRDKLANLVECLSPTMDLQSCGSDSGIFMSAPTSTGTSPVRGTVGLPSLLPSSQWYEVHPHPPSNGHAHGHAHGSVAMMRVCTDPQPATNRTAVAVAQTPKMEATNTSHVAKYRLSFPSDLPIGVEGEDQVVYGLAL